MVFFFCIDDFIEGVGCEGRDYLDDVVGVGGVGEDDFIFWIVEFVEGGGGDVEGERVGGIEYCGGEVDVFDVDEDLGLELDVVVGVVVFVYGLGKEVSYEF